MRAALWSLLVALTLLLSGSVRIPVSDGECELTQPLVHKALLVRGEPRSASHVLLSGKPAKRSWGPLPNWFVLPAPLQSLRLHVSSLQLPTLYGPIRASGMVSVHAARAPPFSLI